MAFQYGTNHVTATAGMKAYFGKDLVDGWPIGPVPLVVNETFTIDPHSDNFQRLLFMAQSTNFAAGTGSVAATTKDNLGTQNKRYRQGSGLPGHENNF